MTAPLLTGKPGPSSKFWGVAFPIFLGLCLAAALLVTCRGKAAEPEPCGPWDHVYKPERLSVIQPCVTVTGTIVDATHGKRKDGVRHEADGDTHGWLRVDPPFRKLLNAGNRSAEGGNLVFEVVCYFPVTQKDAIQACRGYRSTLTVPPVGSRVEIRGTLVQDMNHARWIEIHPVASIEATR